MYNVSVKEEAIKELQKYLYELEGLTNPPNPTGIYDDRTRESVVEFQSKNGLPVSGASDMETFDLIYQEYRRTLEKRNAERLVGASVDFPIAFGDSGGRIYEINEMLARLAEYYGEGHGIRRGGFFGAESARISSVLAEVYGLAESGEINEEIYLRMYKDVESIEMIG